MVQASARATLVHHITAGTIVYLWLSLLVSFIQSWGLHPRDFIELLSKGPTSNTIVRLSFHHMDTINFGE
jgi:hypothetical protein